MKKASAALALLATLLLASPAAHAQQTVVKTKTKSAKNAAATASLPTPPPAPLGGPLAPAPAWACG